MTTINERIKAVRTDAGLSQQAFADILMISKPSVQNYESNAYNRNISAPVIEAICNKFHISRLWLETGEGPMSLQATTDEEIIDEWMADCPEWQKAALIAVVKTPSGWETIAAIMEKYQEIMATKNPGDQ